MHPDIRGAEANLSQRKAELKAARGPFDPAFLAGAGHTHDETPVLRSRRLYPEQRKLVSDITSLHAAAVEVRVSFDEEPVGLDEFLAPFHPVSSTFAGGRLTASLSGSRRDAARFLGALAERYRVADFEVESASLEDAFLEIVRRSREEGE